VAIVKLNRHEVGSSQNARMIEEMNWAFSDAEISVVIMEELKKGGIW
jgi:enoyl-CoA hydratase/carnithine racemase